MQEYLFKKAESYSGEAEKAFRLKPPARFMFYLHGLLTLMIKTICKYISPTDTIGTESHVVSLLSHSFLLLIDWVRLVGLLKNLLP